MSFAQCDREKKKKRKKQEQKTQNPNPFKFLLQDTVSKLWLLGKNRTLQKTELKSSQQRS